MILYDIFTIFPIFSSQENVDKFGEKSKKGGNNTILANSYFLNLL